MDREKWLKEIDGFLKSKARQIEEGQTESDALPVTFLYGNTDPVKREPAKDFCGALFTEFTGTTPEDVSACKDMYAKVVSTFAIACDAYASIFMSEIWASKTGKGACEKKEGFLIVAKHREHGTTWRLALIDRKKRTLEEQKDFVKAEGRFQHMIPMRPVLPEDQRAASDMLESAHLLRSFVSQEDLN